MADDVFTTKYPFKGVRKGKIYPEDFPPGAPIPEELVEACRMDNARIDREQAERDAPLNPAPAGGGGDGDADGGGDGDADGGGDGSSQAKSARGKKGGDGAGEKPGEA